MTDITPEESDAILRTAHDVRPDEDVHDAASAIGAERTGGELTDRESLTVLTTAHDARPFENVHADDEDEPPAP